MAQPNSLNELLAVGHNLHKWVVYSVLILAGLGIGIETGTLGRQSTTLFTYDPQSIPRLGVRMDGNRNLVALVAGEEAPETNKTQTVYTTEASTDSLDKQLIALDEEGGRLYGIILHKATT